MSEVYFETVDKHGYYGDAHSCREAVLSEIAECGGEGVNVHFIDPPDRSNLNDRIAMVGSFLPWYIDSSREDVLFVEAPREKLPHLHVVLGILRSADTDYPLRVDDISVFKTAAVLGYLGNVVPTNLWNGIHTFVDTTIPALKFYKAFQEFVGECFSEDGLRVCPNSLSMGYFLTPEELAKHSKPFMSCQYCGGLLKISADASKPLGRINLHWSATDNVCTDEHIPLLTLQMFTEITVKSPNCREVLIFTKRLVALHLLVNGGKNAVQQ